MYDRMQPIFRYSRRLHVYVPGRQFLSSRDDDEPSPCQFDVGVGFCSFRWQQAGNNRIFCSESRPISAEAGLSSCLLVSFFFFVILKVFASNDFRIIFCCACSGRGQLCVASRTPGRADALINANCQSAVHAADRNWAPTWHIFVTSLWCSALAPSLNPCTRLSWGSIRFLRSTHYTVGNRL